MTGATRSISLLVGLRCHEASDQAALLGAQSPNSTWSLLDSAHTPNPSLPLMPRTGCIGRAGQHVSSPRSSFCGAAQLPVLQRKRAPCNLFHAPGAPAKDHALHGRDTVRPGGSISMPYHPVHHSPLGRVQNAVDNFVDSVTPTSPGIRLGRAHQRRNVYRRVTQLPKDRGDGVAVFHVKRALGRPCKAELVASATSAS